LSSSSEGFSPLTVRKKTIAHEIGHLILHRDTINLVRFLSEDEWKNFRMNLNDKSLAWFETQASEFAARILVPLDPLIINFKEARNETIKINSGWDAPKIKEGEVVMQSCGQKIK
jgi:Zn-dependent peptidase ImmA (M78 family)